jgi:hypothetical protein
LDWKEIAMLRSLAAGAIAWVAVLAGCSTPSLGPIATTSTAVSDPGILGTWTTESPWPMTATVSAQAGDTYMLDLTVTPRDGSPVRRRIDLKLVDIGKHRYADLYLEHLDRDGLFGTYGHLAIPVHQIMKLERTGNTLKAAPIDQAWLEKAVGDAKSGVSHQRVPAAGGEFLILTASPAEIQRFLASHADDARAFPSPYIFQRSGTPKP